MRFRTALASLAIAGGLAGGAQAAVTPSGETWPSAPILAHAGWDASSGSFDCPGCIDVKFAPAPVSYHRAARWRTRHHRARHGRVLRVRG